VHRKQRQASVGSERDSGEIVYCCKLLTVICCVLFSVSPPARGADQDDQEKAPPPLVRRIYDVTELVRVPEVDAGVSAILSPADLSPMRAAQGRSGSGLASTREPATSQGRVEELSRLLQAEIDTNSWADNGGAQGTIRFYETRLIITTSAQNHESIAKFLAELQQQSSRCVRLRATWAALTDEELRSVLEAPQGKTSEGKGARIVNMAALERINGAMRYKAEINALNNQRVNVTAGRARSVLSDLEGIVGNAAAVLQPTIDLVLAGAALQVRPVLSTDSREVTLDIRAVVSRWDPADGPPLKIPQPVASSQPTGSVAPANVRAAPPVEVERLNLPVQLLATATKVPVGRAVLIGGMTGDSGTTDDRRPLYLIIETSTQSAAATTQP
jgi:hypothetical protein